MHIEIQYAYYITNISVVKFNVEYLTYFIVADIRNKDKINLNPFAVGATIYYDLLRINVAYHQITFYDCINNYKLIN